MTSTAFDIVGHLSFALTALAYFMRDILLLRLLAIASGILAIVYVYLINGPQIIAFWQVLLLGINIVRIVTLFRERRSISFSEEEKELYRTIFRRFAPVEFMKLIQLGEWRDAIPGDVLTAQGEPLSDLKMIYNGEVAIENATGEIARSRDGTLIGEVSFVQGGNATATVRAVRPTRYVSWPQEELHKLLKRNPTMDLAMQSVLSEDLTRKLTERSNPHHED